MTASLRPGPPLRFTAPQMTPASRRFIANEAGSAAFLLAATLLAVVWANSPWSGSYFSFWLTPVHLDVGRFGLDLDLRHVVNDAAMAVFFLVLGLEISREVASGELHERRAISVPACGAIGGMLVPIGIYLLINHSGPAAHGWGIVMSSDTAFVLGVLALFGPKCPDQLRLFLLALAVVDDIGAITVMAVFYTDHVKVVALAVCVVLIAAILGLRWLGVWRLTPYVILAIGLWTATYASGVHPTLAGVVTGLLIPASSAVDVQKRELFVFGRALVENPSAAGLRLTNLAASATVPANDRLQNWLHPWSAYLVIPAFGLANAGVSLGPSILRAALTSPVAVGIAVALVAGNAIGITAASALALKTNLGTLPGRVRYSHLFGGAVLAGMGFTISLFITELAFRDPALRDQAKIGILTGSLIAALGGAWILRVMGERTSLCSPGAGGMPPELPPPPWSAPTLGRQPSAAGATGGPQ